MKGQTNCFVRSLRWAKLHCMSHYAIPTVRSHPDLVIINCTANNPMMDESPETNAEKAIELAKSLKSTTNGVVISNIIVRKDKLADKGSKVNNIVENFCKEDETVKFDAAKI